MPQNFLIWLAAVFLLGLVVEWVLEMFVLRKRLFLQIQDLTATLTRREGELSAAQDHVDKSQADLNASIAALARLKKQVEGAQEQVAELLARLNATANAQAAAEQEVQALRAQLGRAQAPEA